MGRKKQGGGGGSERGVQTALCCLYAACDEVWEKSPQQQSKKKREGDGRRRDVLAADCQSEELRCDENDEDSICVCVCVVAEQWKGSFAVLVSLGVFDRLSFHMRKKNMMQGVLLFFSTERHCSHPSLSAHPQSFFFLDSNNKRKKKHVCATPCLLLFVGRPASLDTRPRAALTL
jgi:hypothetical protein